MKHGTVGMYNNGRCRCDACRQASTDYHRAANRRRKRALEAGTVSPPHGTTSTYANYGCRCEACTEANAAMCKAYAAERKASA